MKEWQSKSDVEQEKERLEESTRESLEAAETNRGELSEAATALNEQGDAVLDETKRELNQIVEEFEEASTTEIQKEAEAVQAEIQAEKTEVSDPSREGAEQEKAAAELLEGRAAAAGRYSGPVDAAGRVRREGSGFFDETADSSEGHQAESQEAIDQLSDDARRAAEAVRRF